MKIELSATDFKKIVNALINNSMDDRNLMNEAIKYNLSDSIKTFKYDRFECIKLANKINEYMKQNHYMSYENVYEKCYLSGVELRNYLDWLEKQEA